MSVRKKARTGGIVLSGIVLALVLALPGCNANWPPIGSKEEAKLIAQYRGTTGQKGAGHAGQGVLKPRQGGLYGPPIFSVEQRPALHSRGWPELTEFLYVG